MIDAHQHYWHPARGDYDWMPADNQTLFRPYTPVDLAPHLARHGIHQTVLVQAAATFAETNYMLGIADATPSVGGVVGWIDFEDPGMEVHLKRLATHPKFKGVRPMIQDNPDPDWMLRNDVDWAYKALSRLDLSFDALGFPLHLANFHQILTRHPDLRAVIDHAMKPHIPKPSQFDDWAEGMTRLARDTTACVKLSGLVTEAGPDWQIDDLRPYTDHLIATFGPSRMMWGSDWPVCQLAASFDQWHDAAMALTAKLSGLERAAIFGETARRFYRLSSA